MSWGPLLAKRNPERVRVAYGIYQDEFPAAGMTIEEARDRFRDLFDISIEATALLDGRPAAGSVRLRPGQCLAFVRPAGELG